MTSIGRDPLAGPRWRVRRAHWAVLAVGGLLVSLLQVLPSGANHVGSVSGVFESRDGNLDNDHASASVDWNSFTNNSTATAWRFTQVPPGDGAGEESTGNPDDIYNGGVKQDRNCPATKEGSLGSGSGKIDLTRIYLAHQKLPTPDTSDGATEHDYLFIAWGRVDGSDAASSHVGYEFNRGTVSCGGTGGLVNRIAGDRLFVFDFSGGDADAQVTLRTWITSGTCEVSNNTPPCWGAPQTGLVFDGDVNSGSAVDDDIQGDSLGLVQFGEAGIDLTAAGIDPCDLSGLVTGVSRSSGDSGSAQMKDKVGPEPFQLPGCTQATTITTRVRMTDTASIQGFDSVFVGDHTGTLTFKLYGPDGSSSNCSTEANPVFTSTHSNVATSNFVASGFYEVTSTGTYRWRVRYSGDSANLPSDTGCNAEVVNVNYNFGG